MEALNNNIELIRGLNLCNKIPRALITFIVIEHLKSNIKLKHNIKG